jgi:transcription factor C subunit 6
MGFNGASLLASGTGAGLVRIDKLEGSWFGERVPYNGVENIRGEDGTSMDEDEDSD